MKYIPKFRRPQIDFKKLVRRTLVLAVILLVISGYLAYTRIYLTPERRFWMAMDNNLSLPSVVRSTESGGTGNKSIETIRFEFGGQAAQDKVSSVGFKNATTESNVTTETLNTPATQYVRYKNIFSTEKKADGKAYNFDSIKNIWAKEDVPSDAQSLDNQRLAYLQPLITLVPFGNLPPAARQEVVAYLKSSGAYEVDFKRPTYQTSNGQKYINYDVEVHTKKYVAALQHYFTTAGLGVFPPLNPSGYSDNAHVSGNFIVEMKNNTLSAISFNRQNESYSNYGVLNQLTLPKTTIPLAELQARLQAAQ